MQQINGIQLNSKIGTNFNSQYNVPDTALTNNTTMPLNPLYNLFQVVFQNKQTDKLGEYSNSDIFQNNGLLSNPTKNKETGNKLSTIA